MPSPASSPTSVSTSATSSGIERARDLVEQHQPRLHRERAHDRDALLLPTREPIGVVVALVPHADPVEQRVRPVGRVGLRELEHLGRRERHVVEHAHVREQVEALEHDPDVLAQRVQVDAATRHPLAVEPDLTLLDRLQRVDAAQQRRLAAARRPDEAHDLVLLDAQGHAAQHLVVAEVACGRRRARGRLNSPASSPCRA